MKNYPYTAVIIDDEEQLRDTNRMLLADNFPNVELVGQAASVKEAVNLIHQFQPNLVFLDIELEDGNGFHVLQQCKDLNLKVIFVTAYNQYAIKAIKFNAIDYILKPVNEFEFVSAVQNALNTLEEEGLQMQMNHFFEQYQNNFQTKKIVLRTNEALHLVVITDIMYCKSDNSYTTFYIKSHPPIIVSKSIKEYANLLEEYGFIRPHQSYLVNINCIAKIDKTDGGFIVLCNGDEVPISARRKQLLMDVLERL